MWVEDPTELNLSTDDMHYHWLTKPDILSKALKAMCDELTVQVISQELSYASIDEQQILEIQESNSLIREVYLVGDGVPWVFARVVVPFKTYLKHKDSFDSLGNKLLGEALLYSDPSFTRSEFTYALTTHNGTPIWSRRSVFGLNGLHLLVTEGFLPQVPPFHDAD